MVASHKHRLLQVGFAFAAIAILVLGIRIISSRQAQVPTETLAALNVQKITERALEIAGADYQGKPTDIRAVKTTIGELDVISCNPVGALVNSVTELLEGEPDWCNPKTSVWTIGLSGEFGRGDTVTHSLSIVLDGAGRFIRMGSGAMAQPAESD